MTKSPSAILLPIWPKRLNFSVLWENSILESGSGTLKINTNASFWLIDIFFYSDISGFFTRIWLFYAIWHVLSSFFQFEKNCILDLSFFFHFFDRKHPGVFDTWKCCSSDGNRKRKFRTQKWPLFGYWFSKLLSSALSMENPRLKLPLISVLQSARCNRNFLKLWKLFFVDQNFMKNTTFPLNVLLALHAWMKEIILKLSGTKADFVSNFSNPKIYHAYQLDKHRHSHFNNYQ